jgi:Cys-tRNA(Pro)/Cys-tRNA(Cys) deacylase
MKKKYPTVIHSSVTEFDKIIISGGMIGAQLILSPADLIKITDAKVEDIIF